MIISLAHTLVSHAPAFNAVGQLVLAATDPTTDNGTDDESKKSGPIALVVIILLCVACYFLFKSMSKHLRRVREGSVDEATPAATGSGAPGPSEPADVDAPQESPEQAAAPPQ